MKENVLIPLFSTPLVIYIIDEEVDMLKSMDDIPFIPIRDHNTSKLSPTYISKNTKILDDFQNLKKVVEKYFNHYKNDVMKYENTEFEMTTSWVTKTIKDSMSHYHNHKNSVFSGVLYLSDSDEDTAPIEFLKSDSNSNIFIKPEEYNVYNSPEYKLYPQKNMLLFFPSNLMHRIGFHQSSKERYSISFNFFPVGELGEDDSLINFDIQ